MQDRLKALRFRYQKGISEANFETLPFYLRTLRDFLHQHRGDVVWLKGGIIEQPAHLIYKETLQPDVANMMAGELKDYGMYRIEAVDPLPLLRKYTGHERACVGLLETEGAKLGSLESLGKAEPVNYKEGFWLDQNTFIKADDAELVTAQRQGNPTFMVILHNVVVMTCNAEGRIVSVVNHKKYGVWLDNLERVAREGPYRYEVPRK